MFFYLRIARLFIRINHDIQLPFAVLAPQLVCADIRCNAINPGVQRCRSLKAPKAFKKPDKDLLDHIIEIKTRP